jgi:hypothetical protein
MSPLLDPDRTTVEARTLSTRVALLSIDVETDHGTGRDDALSQIDRLLDLLAEIDVPLTAFVEGQFFEHRRPICRLLCDRGVDVQLHCYDHSEPGDTPASLRRGADALADFCGRPAGGYRAHTYRLTHELFETLLALGFQWDSSLMRGFGQGRNRHRRFRQGDYFVLGGQLFEFPVATWRGTLLPLTHAYRLLLKKPAEAALWAVSGPGLLVAYNVHMTDLVRSDSLRYSKMDPVFRLLHRYLWATHHDDTFASLASLLTRLRGHGHEFLTTQALYDRLTSAKAETGALPGP